MLWAYIALNNRSTSIFIFNITTYCFIEAFSLIKKFEYLFFVGPPDEPTWHGHTSGRATASVCGLQDFPAVTALLRRSEGVHQDPAQRWNY